MANRPRKKKSASSQKWLSASWWAGLSGVVGAIGVIVTVFAWLLPRTGSDEPSPSVSASRAGVHSASPAASPVKTRPIRRTGNLVIRAGWGYDLDVKNGRNWA